MKKNPRATNSLKAVQLEWPTLLLILLCHGLVWVIAVAPAFDWVATALALCVLTLALTLYQSLTHEVIHGHPTRSASVNSLLIAAPYALLVPYARFRDTHLAHHHDSNLTDPYEDPESHYIEPARWERLPHWAQKALLLNNTLLGRMLLGPALIMLWGWREIRGGDRAVQRAWFNHLLLVGLFIAAWLWIGQQPLWLLIASAYLSSSLIMVRTYLEHQAHISVRGRSVIIERTACPFAFLFLFNSLHAVHHSYPRLPWYQLPAFYRQHRALFLKRNHGYAFSSYPEIIRRFAFRRKEPVPHPLMDRPLEQSADRDRAVLPPGQRPAA